MLKLQKLVETYDFELRSGTRADFSDLANDISEGDKFELGRTRRNDWRAELEATMINAHTCVAIRHKTLNGVALLGATRADESLAQSWFLQSESFTGTTLNVLGRKRPFIFQRATELVIDDFVSSYTNIFNFVPASREPIIKWLMLSGFKFFEHPHGSIGVLLFGVGPEVLCLGKDPKFWNKYFPNLANLESISEP